MVVTYMGKLDYSPYSLNSVITVVVPDSIRDNHTCLIYWQWGVNGSGQKNENVDFHGQFQGVEDPVLEVRQRDTGDPYYWFLWNLDTQMLQLMNKNDDECGKPTKLTLVYKPFIHE